MHTALEAAGPFIFSKFRITVAEFFFLHIRQIQGTETRSVKKITVLFYTEQFTVPGRMFSTVNFLTDPPRLHTRVRYQQIGQGGLSYPGRSRGGSHMPPEKPAQIFYSFSVSRADKKQGASASSVYMPEPVQLPVHRDSQSLEGFPGGMALGPSHRRGQTRAGGGGAEALAGAGSAQRKIPRWGGQMRRRKFPRFFLVSPLHSFALYGIIDGILITGF